MKIICIEGCTASGKSDLALLLAKELQTEIISADSRQVYKLLDIGTAKPNKQTLSEVSHHLIDILTPDQRYSAGNFVKDARNIIQSLHKQSKVAILCGGTMLYFKCLLEGLSDIPDIDKEAMQKADEYMSSHSLPDCYEYVKSFDPKFASTILPTDKQRIHRALCVWFAFEKPITSFWETEVYLPVFTPLKILLNRDRETIYQRINTRTAAMVSAGLLQEIESVLYQGYSPSDYGLTGVGYAEFLDIICQKNTSDKQKLQECIDLAAQHTRNYAKRQITWYRKSSFDIISDDYESILAKAKCFAKA